MSAASPLERGLTVAGWISVALGVALYVAALALPALSPNDRGVFLLLAGWAGMLGCVEPAGFGFLWFANFLVPLGALVRMVQGRGPFVLSLGTQLVGLALALAVLAAPGRMAVMVNEGGEMRTVEQLEWGAAAWIASLAVLTLGTQLLGAARALKGGEGA